MHRSSETVAALATDLAKAQTELSNPAKSSIGSIRLHNQEVPEAFRYAPLSSGLDIVRKTLGGHQIAVVQTTNIDRAGGTINLTTVLLHTSGEWISSDWPVCALAEISQPRRMGAALTYARRYALFTLVGIAGDDDLDASDSPPEANAGPLATGHVAAQLSDCASKPPAQGGAASPSEPQIAASLIAEIEGCRTSVDLNEKAEAILKAKNRLYTQDAKQVEEAFTAKLAALAEPLVECAPPENLPPVNSDGTDHPPISLRRDRRGRTPRKKSATASDVPQKEPAPSGTDRQEQLPKPSTSENEVFAIPKEKYLRDKAHLKFVAAHPCLICERSPCDAHHVRYAQPRAMGRKVSDEFAVPLCRAHHRDNHRFGDEREWWSKASIDPIEVSQKLWATSQGRAPNECSPSAVHSIA